MARVPQFRPLQETAGVAPQVDFSPLRRAAGDLGESAGAALADAGSELGRMAVRMQERLNDAALREADADLLKAKTEIFNDPENGYFARRGKTAVDTYGATIDDLDGRAQEIRERLNPALHDKWDQIVSMRRAAAVQSMSSHRLREQTRYEDETSDARLQASLDDAVANWTDDGVRRQAFATAADELNEIAERKGWSAEVLEARQKEFASSVHAGTLDQIIPTSPREARAYLQRNRENISAKVIAASERSIVAEERRREAEAQRQRALIAAETSAALSVGILEGTVTQDIIDLAHESGQITASSWASLRKAFNTAEEKRAKEADVFAIVAAGGPLDPGDKDHRDAVGSIFKAAGGIEGLTGKSPEMATQTAEIAESTGIVPPQAVAFVRGAIASGDDGQRQYAFDLVGRLDEIAPKALQRAFSAEDLTEALTYNKLTRAGVSDAQAMESINASRTLDQGTRDARRKEGAKQFQELDVEDAFFDPSALPFDQGDLPTVAPLADRITDDARAVYLDAFLRSGDADVATDVTRRTLARTYGRSEVAGSGDVMQYPPEAFYEIPGIENDWMREQLLEDVKAVAPKATLDGIELVPTPRTASDVRAGLAPRYQVLVRDENGIYEPVRDDDGKPMDYRFDPSKLIEARRVELEAKREKFVRTETLNAETSDALGVTNAEGFGDAL